MESLLENWGYKLVRTLEVGKKVERVREQHAKLIYSTRATLVRAKVTHSTDEGRKYSFVLKIEACK